MRDETMRKRGLANRRPISSNIQIDILYKFEDLAKTLKRNKTRLLDEAIVLLLKAYGCTLTDEQLELISHLNQDK